MEAKAYLLKDSKYGVDAISQISALHMKAFASPIAFLWPLSPLLN